MVDEPLCKTPPKVHALELEAIRQYRTKYPDGVPWQDLDHSTRWVWVAYVEIQEKPHG